MKTIKTIGTHSGQFHVDEVLACIFLTKYTEEFKDAKITRSRDPKILDQLDLVCDVGGNYEPSRHRYDHHQVSFTETFSSQHKIKLSSAGLIYKHFGLEVISNALVQCMNGIKLTIQPPIVEGVTLNLIYQKIYKNFVQAIDAIDNGVDQYENPGEARFSQNTNLGYQIGRLNPMWTEEADENERFYQAMVVANAEFISIVRGVYLAWLPARKIVEEAFALRHQIHGSGSIMRLDSFAPWKSHLHDIEEEQNMSDEIKFVLYKDAIQEWRVQGVNLKPDSFELRKQINKSWCGIKDMDLLRKETNIHDVVFVHVSGFIGGAKSYESTLKMAIESL